jgi:hypothetical protein
MRKIWNGILLTIMIWAGHQLFNYVDVKTEHLDETTEIVMGVSFYDR